MSYIKFIFLSLWGQRDKHLQNIKKNDMKKMSTIAELDLKMIKIAASVNMTIEAFRKLPRKKFIQICNNYNANNN